LWHYSGLRPLSFPNAHASPSASHSTVDLLLSLRGSLLGLRLPASEPQGESRLGTLDEVTARHLGLGLVVPVPRMPAGTPLVVEIQDGQFLLRFAPRLVKAVEDHATHLETTLPQQVESVQRRQFSRQRLTLNILYAMEATAGSPKQDKTGLGQAIDLSLGGLRMIAQSPIPVGQRLFLSFTLTNGAGFRGLTAHVIRSHMEGSRPIVALKFELLAPTLEAELFHALTHPTYKSPVQR
jgi:hypothetical protein